MPPALHIRIDQKGRVAIISFRGKMGGINYKSCFILLRRSQAVAGLKIESGDTGSRKNPLQSIAGYILNSRFNSYANNMKQMAAFL